MDRFGIILQKSPSISPIVESSPKIEKIAVIGPTQSGKTTYLYEDLRKNLLPERRALFVSLSDDRTPHKYGSKDITFPIDFEKLNTSKLSKAHECVARVSFRNYDTLRWYETGRSRFKQAIELYDLVYLDDMNHVEWRSGNPSMQYILKSIEGAKRIVYASTVEILCFSGFTCTYLDNKITFLELQ